MDNGAANHYCHACSFDFNDTTQVIRPVAVESIWIEVGTGSLVRVMEISGDPFDPSTPIRYKIDSDPDTTTRVMLAEDFRYYFRPKKNPKPPKAVTPHCKIGEEWESTNGGIYAILHLNKDGDVYMAATDNPRLSFWVKGHDFVRMFSKFIRLTDYTRLLGDDDP
jgi:hypothetical protein